MRPTRDGIRLCGYVFYPDHLAVSKRNKQVENSEGGQQMVERSKPNKALAIRFKRILKTIEAGGEESYIFEKKKDEQGNPTMEDAEFYSFTGSKILIDQAERDFTIEDLPCPTVVQQFRAKNGQTFVKFT